MKIFDKSETADDIKKIEIIDGHDCSSYFWIMPVRIVDYSNTCALAAIDEMTDLEISIEEDDVDQYLSPFLYKHFDSNLLANKNRYECFSTDEYGNEEKNYITGFEWYLTSNFYTFDSIRAIIDDLKDTIDALKNKKTNEFTDKLRIKRGSETRILISARNMSDEEIKAYNESRPKVDNTLPEVIIDFYERLIFKLEYMIKVGGEKGYDLISVMGP